MKKTLLLITALSFCMTSQAIQFEVMGNRSHKPKISQTVNTRADEGYTFGYCAQDEELSGFLGVGQIADLYGFIQIPEELAKQWTGNKVTDVMVGVGVCKNLNLKLIFTEDPESATQLYTQNFKVPNAGKWSTLQLTDPFEITGKAFYVGYMIQQTATQYPLGIDNVVTDNPYGSLVGYKTSSAQSITWENLGSGYGNLYIRLKMEGENVPQNSASIYYQEMPQYYPTNKGFGNDIYFQNTGANPINSIEVACKFGDQVVATGTMNETVPNGALGLVEMDNIVCPIEGPNVPYTLSITKVNGVDNTSLKFLSEVSGTMGSSIVSYDKNVVVEEFTGTWCQWCPRGIVGMEYMEKTYGNEGFIGIGVHSGDEMAVNSYASVINLYASGFPDATVDRTYSTDPNQEDLEDYYLYAREFGSPAQVSIEASYDEGKKVVYVTGKVVFGFDLTAANPYKFAFVITENNVGPYNQSNAYASGSNGYLEGWTGNTSSVSTYFNDVARIIKSAFGIDSSLPAEMKKGEEYTYTTNVSTTAVKDINNCDVIALLLDAKSGSITNAAKMKLTSAGINAIEEDNRDEVFRVYNPQGFKVMETSDASNINTLPSGIYIVNGKKVMVR